MAHPTPVFIHSKIAEVIHEREEKLRGQLDRGEITQRGYDARRMPQDIFKVIDKGFHRAFDLFDDGESQ